MKPIVLFVLVIVLLGIVPDAQAQRLGKFNRKGAASNNMGGVGDSSEVGSITGSERFLRDNRGKGDFVGRDPDSRDTFVGSQQGTASGRVRSAAQGMRIEKARDANVRLRPATRRRHAMYDPRLAVDFEFSAPSSQEMTQRLTKRLEASLRPNGLGRSVEVSVQGDTAILRGTVSTEHDRSLTAFVVLLEPGIAEVKNEIEVGNLMQR